MRTKVPVTPIARKKSNTFLIVIVCFLLFGSVTFLIAGITEAVGSHETVDISTVAYADIKTGDEYYFNNNMLIAGTYAKMTQSTTQNGVVQSKSETTYALVVFYDAKNNPYYASLEIKPADDIYQTVMKIVKAGENDDINPYITGCFECKPLDQDNYEYYQDGIDEFNKQLIKEYEEEFGYSNNPITVTKSMFNFKYDASDPQAYKEMKQGLGTTLCIAGGIMLLVTGLCLFLLLKKRKKIQQEIAQAAAEAAEAAQFLNDFQL
ncbi:MAG: hypothetical protein J1E00_02635 [Oscillospiraceae bacterium]|nr:hypothetical protein [Oscillospiraceae bacterium]